MTPLEVHSKLKNSKNVSPIMNVHIDNALSYCPKEVIDYIAEKCIFISCSRDNRPFVSFLGDVIELGIDYYIFLPCGLLKREETQRR